MANINKAGKKAVKKDLSAIESQLVYMNDGIRICSEACSSCWDTPLPSEYDKKVEYLGKRAKIGHTSIFEHSNLIMLIKIQNVNSDDLNDLIDFLCASKYINLRYRIKYTDTDPVIYILLGGSYRGYDELFNLSEGTKHFGYVYNKFLKSIARILYENVDSHIFYDLIEKNILDESKFVNIEPDPVANTFNNIPDKEFHNTEKTRFISVDNIVQIKKNLTTITGSSDLFTFDDIARVATMTILFKNMSRTATHQLVRHRNAITQESQRYVDYSTAAFADPCEFKPTKYDKDKKYKIQFQGQEFELTSMELGEAIIGFYDDMRNGGMLKEDARAFLPGNVKCRKLYMTFTYANFIKFLELRTDSHAQAEIRSFALDCADAYESFKLLEDSSVDDPVDEIISDKNIILDNIIKNNNELKEND